MEMGNNDPYRGAKNFSGLWSSSSVLWKAEFAIDEIDIQLGRFLISLLKELVGFSRLLTGNQRAEKLKNEFLRKTKL